jgi:arabinofuranan 3-O-arabinosyltransferase
LISTDANLTNRLRAQPLWIVWGLFAFWALAHFGVPLIAALQTYVSRGVFFGVNIYDRDFANYWVAGKLVLSGEHLMLFTHDTYFAHLQSLFGPNYQIHSWSYPPHYLLLMWPLGFLGYEAALLSFLLVTLAIFAASAMWFRRTFAPETSLSQTVVALVPFVVMMLAATQNGFLIGTFMLVALAFMKSRPWVAGLALALLTVKPQLGLLFAVIVLMDRNWRVLAWTVAFAVALAALSVLLFGLESWQAYFREVIPYQQSVMTDWYGIFLRMMPSVFGSVRTLEYAPATAFASHWVFAASALPLLVWLLWKIRDPLQRAFILLAGTFLLTPYSFNYDMGALSLVAALLAQSMARRSFRLVALCIALVAVLPGVMTALGLASLPLSPLILAGAVAALAAASLRKPAAPALTPA